MSKHFRPWKIDERQLLPPSVQDYVPKDHLSRLIVALVRESLDLSAINGSYTSGLGQPPFEPRMMTALLLHGYASGLYSSRRIAKACVERAEFMMIVAGDAPDFRTISEFRRRHLRRLADLFVQVLQLAEQAGLVKLGHVALDGTKIKANASKHKAMSYARMKKREAELKPKSTAGLRPPKRPMRRRTGSTATSAATRCLIGWPTSRSGWRRSGKPRPRWRPRLKPPPTRRSGGANRQSRSALRKTGKRAAGRRHRRKPSPMARRNATSPLRKAAS